MEIGGKETFDGLKRDEGDRYRWRKEDCRKVKVKRMEKREKVLSKVGINKESTAMAPCGPYVSKNNQNHLITSITI